MAENYEEKKTYYIPAYVEKIRELGKCPVKVSFRTGEERCAVDFENSPGLLFTAEEVAENVDLIARSTLDEYSEKAQRKIEALTKQLEEANETIKAFSESEDIVRTNFDAKVDENKELKSRNAELEALLKEVMATRDEAIRQNDELIAKNKRLDAENLRLRNKVIERTTDVDNLMKENANLKSDCNDWKDTADERIVDVQHLTEENDKLKAENDNLRTQVGGYAVDIQDLASDVNFYKADRDKWLNTAQDNAKLVDALQEENKSLKQELKAAEEARDGAVDTSLERKNRVVTMEEVIAALVEKIRRLEGDD